MAGGNAMLNSVLELSDDELLEKLQEHGFTGPIVDSTRSVYQKKLIQILEGGYIASPDVGDSEEEEEKERSDPEDNAKPQILKSSNFSNSSFGNSGSPFTIDNEEVVRQRIHKPSPPRPTSFPSNSSLQHPASPYMVTSRPSLSSVSGRESTYTSFAAPPRQSSQAKVDKSSSSAMVSKAKLLIAVVVAIVLAFVFYQNLEGSHDDNPVPKLV